MDISALKPEEKIPLEDFFATVFGEEFRSMAREEIARSFSDEFARRCFVIARSESGIIGAAAFGREMFTTDIWGISWVAVHPDCRNQGVGQQIIETCIREIATRINRPSTAILATIPGKSGLYEKTGFSGSTTDHEDGRIMTKIVMPIPLK